VKFDMKKCELCKFAAKSYCESDQASLCWDCDAKVHAANFLVARHSRTLLCNICQSPTPWQGSGEKLGHTVSVCEKCTNSGRLEDEEEESDRANDYDDENDDGDEDERENQVVPWSSKTPPPAASSSSSDFSSVSRSSASAFKNRGISSLKQIRDQVDLGLYLSDRKLTRTGSIDSLPPERTIYVNRFDKKQRQGIWREESRAIDLNLPASPSR
jgi:hypothetical protein